MNVAMNVARNVAMSSSGKSSGLATAAVATTVTTDAPLLEVSDVRKVFVDRDFQTPVLKGVNFTLGRGEMVAMLGPSGSGKSTLLSILGTLMKPTSGSFRMLGRELTTLGEQDLSDFRNQQIGFIFQYHHLLPDFSALENVLFPHAARVGRETRAGRERAAMLLERVGLRDRMHYRATRLSGGQKQRVAIARALMNQPALVLADEPTGNLDRENADQAFALMTEMQRETGTTFLLSTHDRELAERCGRRIYIRAGVIVDEPRVVAAADAAASAAVVSAPAVHVPAAPETAPVFPPVPVPVPVPAAARTPLRVIDGDAVPVVDRLIRRPGSEGEDAADRLRA
jgi:lipoprotein-releasing system ATP-binding protein